MADAKQIERAIIRYLEAWKMPFDRHKGLVVTFDVGAHAAIEGGREFRFDRTVEVPEMADFIAREID